MFNDASLTCGMGTNSELRSREIENLHWCSSDSMMSCLYHNPPIKMLQDARTVNSLGGEMQWRGGIRIFLHWRARSLQQLAIENVQFLVLATEKFNPKLQARPFDCVES